MADRESMARGLTRENLAGVWVAVTTPFDEHDRLDEEILRENIRRLHGAGVHGVYTTDSDGEFYAIEFDEFKRLVDVFADETSRLNFPTMVGVTWCNTSGIVDRLRYAAEKGILGAHVGHPFFMPMTPDSYAQFWRDISAATPDGFGLIHYNTPRVHNNQKGADYAVLQETVPAMIGTKHVGSDVAAFIDTVQLSPKLSHFVGEHAMTPYMLLGGRGIYSWFANYNPKYLLDWYDEVLAGNWEAAAHRQVRMRAFSNAVHAALEEQGNLHGIIGKALTAAGSFLVPCNRTRRPYLPVRDESVQKFREVAEAQFADLLWSPK